MFPVESGRQTGPRTDMARVYRVMLIIIVLLLLLLLRALSSTRYFVPSSSDARNYDETRIDGKTLLNYQTFEFFFILETIFVLSVLTCGVHDTYGFWVILINSFWAINLLYLPHTHSYTGKLFCRMYGDTAVIINRANGVRKILFSNGEGVLLYNKHKYLLRKQRIMFEN